jgi:hypothetical protein
LRHYIARDSELTKGWATRESMFCSLQEFRFTSTVSRLVLGPTQPTGMGKSFPGIKWPDREADHSEELTYLLPHNTS